VIQAAIEGQGYKAVMFDLRKVFSILALLACIMIASGCNAGGISLSQASMQESSALSEDEVNERIDVEPECIDTQTDSEMSSLPEGYEVKNMIEFFYYDINDDGQDEKFVIDKDFVYHLKIYSFDDALLFWMPLSYDQYYLDVEIAKRDGNAYLLFRQGGARWGLYSEDDDDARRTLKAQSISHHLHCYLWQDADTTKTEEYNYLMVDDLQEVYAANYDGERIDGNFGFNDVQRIISIYDWNPGEPVIIEIYPPQ